jgi:demethylmacrocin O-methyltransferase
LVTGIIAAAGGSGRDLAEALERLGAAEVADLLADELVFRCGYNGRVHQPVAVDVQLAHGDLSRQYRIVIAPSAPAVLDPGTDAPVVLRAEFGLEELVRQFFGAAREGGTAGCRLDMRIEGGSDQDWALSAAATVAADRVVQACSGARPNLGELAIAQDSDKWGGLHWFTQHYDRHFRELRNDAVRVLEIGVGGYGYEEMGGGGSLRMWKRYFHRGLIYGMDIYDKSRFDQTRIKTIIGDQSDPAMLREISAEYGPFDIIIDDGSHVNEHIITSFHTLFPLLRPGGFYVIEDLWTTYQPVFGGKDTPVAGPDTSLGLLKSLVDGLHYQERSDSRYGAPGEIEGRLTGLHLYHNIAFLEKGRNAEGGVPEWIPQLYSEMVAAEEAK